jgi:SAM-dependent methyltransferase
MPAGRIKKLISQIINGLQDIVRKVRGFDSGDYWERRYAGGRDSGAGSYGRLAEFKAEVVNDLVQAYGIDTIVEFGCGDGNQLKLYDFKDYLGFDVSRTAVQWCRDQFQGDETKQFKHLSEYAGQTAELAMSIDVIFHLVEDDVYNDYMERLFRAAEQAVLVYSSNFEDTSDDGVVHVRHRRFTDWISEHRPEWKLAEHVPNRFPLEDDANNQSFADFYLFTCDR